MIRPSRRSDSAFPWLDETDRLQFPDARTMPGDQPALVGANLSPGVLLSAYEQGYFPWSSEDEPLYWWSPDPRFVVYVAEVHESESMRKILRQGRFRISFDTAFREVITACSKTPRPGQNGTWIRSDVIDAYCDLHQRGIAHSAEAWLDDRLVGGLYGVGVGLIFCGESMFSHVPNASKAAFLTLVRFLREAGVWLIDSQVYTNHLASLGGREIERDRYLEELNLALSKGSLAGAWVNSGW